VDGAGDTALAAWDAVVTGQILARSAVGALGLSAYRLVAKAKPVVVEAGLGSRSSSSLSCRLVARAATTEARELAAVEAGAG
jgi:hypothetical protein